MAPIGFYCPLCFNSLWQLLIGRYNLVEFGQCWEHWCTAHDTLLNDFWSYGRSSRINALLVVCTSTMEAWIFCCSGSSRRCRQVLPVSSTYSIFGPWLWRSWQSGRFRHQSSVVLIPTLTKFFENICQLQFRKDKNKVRGAGIGPFKKSYSIFLSKYQAYKACLSLSSIVQVIEDFFLYELIPNKF